MTIFFVILSIKIAYCIVKLHIVLLNCICYNANRQREVNSPCNLTINIKNPRAATLGFSIPFLVVGLSPQAHYWLHITVQPFDDVMANYTTHNSDNKRSEKIHVIHLLPVASMEAATLSVYHMVFWISIYVEINWGLIWNLIQESMITRTCIKSRKLFLFRFRRWEILKRQNYAKNGLPKFATRHSAQTGKFRKPNA